MPQSKYPGLYTAEHLQSQQIQESYFFFSYEPVHPESHTEAVWP